MRTFEFVLEVAPLADDVEDAIYGGELDALVASHGDSTWVIAEAEGDDAVLAGARLLVWLRELGARVLAVQDDLVTRREIAERASVTSQAVGMWVRGERQADFPRAHNRVAGGIWLWSDVQTWLVDHGVITSDGLERPAPRDVVVLNDDVERFRSTVAFHWSGGAVSSQARTTGGAPVVMKTSFAAAPATWADSQTDHFSLAC